MRRAFEEKLELIDRLVEVLDTAKIKAVAMRVALKIAIDSEFQNGNYDKNHKEAVEAVDFSNTFLELVKRELNSALFYIKNVEAVVNEVGGLIKSDLKIGIKKGGNYVL